MVYRYIRVSTDHQTTENQRFEILKFCEKQEIVIDCWIEEIISATKDLNKRKLGSLIKQCGSCNAKKLLGREKCISQKLEEGCSKYEIAKRLRVHRDTLAKFIADNHIIS